MKDKAILLIHGMGSHPKPAAKKGESAKPPKVTAGAEKPAVTKPAAETPEPFTDQFLNATTATLQRFPQHAADTFEDYVDVHELNYDEWFDVMRKQMADTAKDMKERLAAVNASYQASIPLEFASTLTGLEAKFGQEKFFNTHWLDVVFYGTMLGAKIRVDVAAKVSELVESYGGGNVHIIAHSLGTAVLHDTLHLLYRREHDPDDAIPDLNLVDHNLGSVWMVANVSRMVNSVTRFCDPLGSVVKPGEGGCTGGFYNIRHALDPFTWLAQFNPKNNGAWITEEAFNAHYRSIVTELIVEANTHSFTQYLQDPKVVERMFPLLLGAEFNATLEEFMEVANDYIGGSLNGAYAALEDSLKTALKTPDSIGSWMDFMDTAKKFEDAVTLIREKF